MDVLPAIRSAGRRDPPTRGRRAARTASTGGRVGRWLSTVVPSSALTLATVHQLLYNHGAVTQWVLAQLLVWPLVVRRRAPTTVLAITTGAAALCWAIHLLLVGYLAVLVALYEVAARRSRLHAGVAAAVVEAGAVLVAVRFTPASSVNDAVIILTASTLSFLFLGTTRHAQQQYLAALEDRAADLEREHHQRAVIAAGEERARIARELHDIVAHSVSVMITLSEGAAARAVPDPPRAREVMRDVAATGREALVELRKVVTVLRDPRDRSREPQPTLDGLTDLVHDFRRSGVPAFLRTAGDLGSVPPVLQANAYRIVQEGLTNVLKHAVVPTEVIVDVRLATGELSVLVHDHAAGPPMPTPAGNGIRGMRERVDLFGGRLESGPVADGWQVAAVLPAPSSRP